MLRGFAWGFSVLRSDVNPVVRSAHGGDMNAEILLDVVQKEDRCVLTATHVSGSAQHADLLSWAMELCAFLRRNNPEWRLESVDGANACCTVFLTRAVDAAQV